MPGAAGEPSHDMHGRSFRAAVEGDAATFRETHISGYYAGADRVVRSRDLGDGRAWSLILRPAGAPDELYELTADPREHPNLIDDHHDVAARLAGRFGATYFRRQARVTAAKGVQGAYEVASGAVE